MIVIHIAASVAGGAGLGLWRYHCALRQAGVDSRVLVLDPPTRADNCSAIPWKKRNRAYRLAHRLGLVRTKRERLLAEIAALNASAPAASYELFTLPFSDYHPEEHPWIAEADAVNLHWTADVLDWPRFFARVHQPVLLTLHDQQPYLGGFHYECDARANPQLAPLEAQFRAVKQQSLRGRRLGVVANSRWNAEAARASGFFAPATPIESIYYPLDIATYAPHPRTAAQAALGLDPAKLVVGFASENLNNRRKGFADLLAALSLLPASLRGQVSLLSFGRDPAAELRAKAGLPWRHLGYLEDDAAKVTAYAAMDVFVVPSHAEAFGLTAIEAQAVGVPVVANPVDGLREAVDYAAADYPAAPVPELVCAGLTALLTNKARWHERATQGRQAVSVRHDPARVGPQLADFCRRVIG